MEFTELQSRVLIGTGKLFHEYFNSNSSSSIWVDNLLLTPTLKKLGLEVSAPQASAALGQLARKGIFKRQLPDSENRRNGFHLVISYLTPLGREVLGIPLKG